jgi:mercuric ion binding protein
MRRYIAALSVSAVILAATGSRAAERTVTLAVDNMSCELCPITVKASLARVPGVSDVAVSFAAATATVTFDDAVADIEDLIAATTNAGYPARPAE